MRIGPSTTCALAAAWLSGLLMLPAGSAEAAWGAFSGPQEVLIEGWSASAEEPFITPDGRYLLFNSSEAVPDFGLEYAARVGPQQFVWQGPILGEEVNDPQALSGTPSIDDEGELYFISTRSYFATLSTVYAGRFQDGTVSAVHLVAGVSGSQVGKVDFDAGVSPDGASLLVSVGQFGAGGGPTSAEIEIYERRGEEFVLDADSAKLMKAVNAVGALDYAADLSASELELFFTAASPAEGEAPAIYRATRRGAGKAFGHVERIAAITGFAEAPSVSSDGTTLYYHEDHEGQVSVRTVTRVPGAPSVSALAPARGPQQGGTPVTIRGSGFAPGALVRFGSSPASEVNVVSEVQITALSPPGAPGRATVSVETPQGISAGGSRGRFDYLSSAAAAWPARARGGVPPPKRR